MHPLARSLGLCSALLLAAPAAGSPISALFQDDGRCDAVRDVRLDEELGRGAGDPLHPPVPFPHDEALRIQITPLGSVVSGCSLASPGIEVRLTNLSASAFFDLVFVAAPGISVLNADGHVFGLDAFHIDHKGLNATLVESGPVDLELSPGEIWTFRVVSPAYHSIAGSTGGRLGGNTFGIGGADASSYLGYPDFSILAVTEPTGLLAGVGALLGLRAHRARRRRT